VKELADRSGPKYGINCRETLTRQEGHRRTGQIESRCEVGFGFRNPLELLIALILAAQARDELVNSVTAEVFPKYRTAADW